MKIASREVDGVTILDLEGELTIDSCNEFSREVQHQLDLHKAKLIVNFAQVSRLDVTGCHAVTSTYTKVVSHSGRMYFVGANRQVKAMLGQVWLKVVPLWDSEQDALKNLSYVR